MKRLRLLALPLLLSVAAPAWADPPADIVPSVEALRQKVGAAGVSIAIGVSELGPLNVYVSASSPVVLDPASGFAVTNFHAGVTFNASLPSITDPFQLRNTAFTPIAALTDVQWLDALKLSVVNQANAPPGGEAKAS